MIKTKTGLVTFIKGFTFSLYSQGIDDSVSSKSDKVDTKSMAGLVDLRLVDSHLKRHKNTFNSKDKKLVSLYETAKSGKDLF